jgi:hypothetical protein
VGQPFSTHGWNAYAYAGNNPMTFSDPTGMCFAGCFWKTSLFRDIVGIAVAFALDNPEWGFLIGDGLSAGVNAGIAGAASGAISTGTLKGTLLAAAQADSSSGIGDIKDLLTLQNGALGSVLMHATAGGLYSVAGGGKFKSGFLAAGFADLAGPVVDKISQSNMYVGLAAATVTGGLGSVIGGGKFENGAVTGAFGYLFNDLAHMNHTRDGFAEGVLIGTSVGGACAVSTAGVCALGPAEAIGGGIVGIGVVGGFAADAVETLWGTIVHSAGANSSGDVPASTEVGTIRKPIDVPDGTNAPGEIDGRDYTGHAFDRMQGRGIPPSVVEDTIHRHRITA